MIRTYIDAGVLITAARGKHSIAARALNVLDDPNREFISSIFVRFEVLPKGIYFKNQAEVSFYEAFFNAVTHWQDSVETIVRDGYKMAQLYGLAAMDALHLAAAISIQTDELVTTERIDKPLFRASGINVVSIWNDSSSMLS